MEQGTGQKQQKPEQNAAVTTWLYNLRRYRAMLYTAQDRLAELGYTGEYVTYKQRADIIKATLDAAEADERLDQSDPMDRVWMIKAILSYEKDLERLLGWPKELWDDDDDIEL